MTRINKLIILSSVLIVLVIIAIIFILQSARVRNNHQGGIMSETKNADELASYAKGLYVRMHLSSIEEVGDVNFTSFVKETIDLKCPFYEPDGATYRGCLIDWKDELLKVFKGSKINLDNIQSYCEGISNKYSGSLEGEELWLDCMIYKLSPAK